MEEYLIIRMSNEMDANGKLELAEELLLYFKNLWHYKTSRNVMAFIRKLTDWIRSSSLQIQLITMKIIAMIATKMKDNFQLYLTAVLVPLTDKLGDSNKAARSSAQSLVHIMMTNCVTNPQAILDHVLDTCLSHKSFKMKRGGLICLMRTITSFGIDKIKISKHANIICDLLYDKDSRVQELGMDALVDLHLLAGKELRKIIPTCNISTQKLEQLYINFNLADSGEWTRSIEKRKTKSYHLRNGPISPRWDGSPNGRQKRQRTSSVGHAYLHTNNRNHLNDPFHVLNSKQRMSLGGESHPTTRSSRSNSSYYTRLSSQLNTDMPRGWGSESWKYASARESTSGASRGRASHSSGQGLSLKMAQEVKVIVEETVTRVLKELGISNHLDTRHHSLASTIIPAIPTINDHELVMADTKSESDDDVLSDNCLEIMTSSSDIASVHIMPSDNDFSEKSVETIPPHETTPIEELLDKNNESKTILDKVNSVTQHDNDNESKTILDMVNSETLQDKDKKSKTTLDKVNSVTPYDNDNESKTILDKVNSVSQQDKDNKSKTTLDKVNSETLHDNDNESKTTLDKENSITLHDNDNESKTILNKLHSVTWQDKDNKSKTILDKVNSLQSEIECYTRK